VTVAVAADRFGADTRTRYSPGSSGRGTVANPSFETGIVISPNRTVASGTTVPFAVRAGTSSVSPGGAASGNSGGSVSPLALVTRTVRSNGPTRTGYGPVRFHRSVIETVVVSPAPTSTDRVRVRLPTWIARSRDPRFPPTFRTSTSIVAGSPAATDSETVTRVTIRRGPSGAAFTRSAAAASVRITCTVSAPPVAAGAIVASGTTNWSSMAPGAA